MKIIVNDANILFDLLDIDLIDEFCRLPYEKMITDAVLGEFDIQALESYQAVFDTGKILIHPFTSDQLKEVAILGKTYSSTLSFPDCSCLYLAKKCPRFCSPVINRSETPPSLTKLRSMAASG